MTTDISILDYLNSIKNRILNEDDIQEIEDRLSNILFNNLNNLTNLNNLDKEEVKVLTKSLLDLSYRLHITKQQISYSHYTKLNSIIDELLKYLSIL